MTILAVGTVVSARAFYAPPELTFTVNEVGDRRYGLMYFLRKLGADVTGIGWQIAQLATFGYFDALTGLDGLKDGNSLPCFGVARNWGVVLDTSYPTGTETLNWPVWDQANKKFTLTPTLSTWYMVQMGDGSGAQFTARYPVEELSAWSAAWQSYYDMRVSVRYAGFDQMPEDVAAIKRAVEIGVRS